MSLEQQRKLYDAITDIRDDLIEEAQDARLKAARPKWQRWAALVACAVLAVGIGGVALLQSFPQPGDGAGAGGAGHAEGNTVFMSYDGPVFPLTLSKPEEQVTARRDLTYDFSLAGTEDLRIWGAGVRDGYLLSNSSDEEKTVSAIYPLTGSFADISEHPYSVSVNGQAVRPVLRAGGYSGGFTGVYGEDDPDGSANLEPLNSWEGYKALLADGSYQESAFSPRPKLDQKVTVYEFSDFAAPLEEYHAATQAVSFTIDQEKTTILQYGFEGMEWEEDGFRRYSCFVPDGRTNHPKKKLLIVAGEDIGSYTMQGYQNGGCREGTELEGVSAKVTRSEAVLSDVLDRLVTEYFTQYQRDAEISGQFIAEVPRELFMDSLARLLYEYGPFSSAPAERYEDGRLIDLISEAWSQPVILYLEFPVTIPAGGTASVAASLHKQPSYDFACSGSENVGVQGYDLAARLGSNLFFDALTAKVTNTEKIEIVRQNMGFDLSGGVTEVELDPNGERYYLEIRPLEEES